MKVCRSCGSENPDGFRFCGRCGADLAAGTASGVRKTVTVVLWDLLGSTALGEQSDPEVLREIMLGYRRDRAAASWQHDYERASTNGRTTASNASGCSRLGR